MIKATIVNLHSVINFLCKAFHFINNVMKQTKTMVDLDFSVSLFSGKLCQQLFHSLNEELNVVECL